MCITATYYDNVVVLSIVATSLSERKKDISRIEAVISSTDREYNNISRNWVIRNPDKYESMPEISRAKLMSTKQLRLF